MRMENLIRAFGQAFGEAVSENGKFRFDFDKESWNKWRDSAGDGEGWSSLEALDLTDARPDVLKIALSRADHVRIKSGQALKVKVEGEGADALRFKLDGDTLRILRRGGGQGGDLRIKLTMPAPRRLAIGGAGNITCDTLAEEAQVAIGGSGRVEVGTLSGKVLSAKIGGSGTIVAAGTVETLDVAIGGSGKFDAPHLETNTATIRIGGSGKVEFASDGVVDAKVGGSGDIVVHGQPRCSLKAGGSGRIRCVPRNEGDDAHDTA